jgi:hypothetical protein
MDMYAQLISDKPWPVSELPPSLRYAKEATLNGHGYYTYDVPPKPVVNPATHEVYGPTLAFDGESVTASWLVVEKSLESIKEAKLAELAAARYAQETGGLVVNGATIRTDRESQALITGAALKAMQDEAYVCKWKTESGFVELTAPQILAVADAVRAHVQSCFDHEADLVALIDAAETGEEVEAITWTKGEEE